LIVQDYQPKEVVFFQREVRAEVVKVEEFLDKVRPFTFGIANSIKYVKLCLGNIDPKKEVKKSKKYVKDCIDDFIQSKITDALNAIEHHSLQLFKDDSEDFIAVYSFTNAIERLIVHAKNSGKKFKLLIIDSGPDYEGQALT